MEKKNTLLLTVIAIATLLVAVVGATFAYFASRVETNNILNIAVTTDGGSASFVAVADDPGIEIKVAGYMMQQQDATQDVDNSVLSNVSEIAEKLTSNASIDVTLTAANIGSTSKCTYDLIYVWTSDKICRAKDDTSCSVGEKEYYHRTLDSGTAVAKEFTLQGTGTIGTPVKDSDGTALVFPEGWSDASATAGTTSVPAYAEKNFDQLGTVLHNDAKNYDYVVLVDDAIIETNTKVTVNWDFRARFYNLPQDQEDQKGRTYSGYIAVDPDSVRC